MNISLQLEAGVSETVIAMRVGHTSPELIRSTYGHLIGTIGRRAVRSDGLSRPEAAQGEHRLRKQDPQQVPNKPGRRTTSVDGIDRRSSR
jgi:hypothetical protein